MLLLTVPSHPAFTQMGGMNQPHWNLKLPTARQHSAGSNHLNVVNCTEEGKEKGESCAHCCCSCFSFMLTPSDCVSVLYNQKI